MAEQIGLQAVLDTKDFSKGLNTYLKGIGQMETKSSGIGSKISSAFQGIGKAVLSVGAVAGGAALAGVTALGAGLGAFAVGGIKQAADLDQKMADIAAVIGKTKDEVGPLKDVIMGLSINPNLKVSATEAAQAVELLARNGALVKDGTLIADEAIQQLTESTVALSNATGAEFGTAADIATDVMAIFNKDASEMGSVIDGITGVTTNSKFAINDYRLALANAGAVGAGMGLTFEDMNTVIAATASSFSKGADAGTSLKTLLQRLANPTAEMTAEMDKYGISLFDGEGNMRSMAEIADQLNSVFNGTATITQTVGGVTAEMTKAAEQANAKLPKLNATISEQERELAKLEREHAEVIRIYGESSPAVEDHTNKILTLTDKLALNKAEQANLQGALGAVANAREEVITSTKNLTEEEKANLAAVLGGADASRQIIALSQLSAEEFNNLSKEVNKEGQAMAAAATRVDSFQGAMEILKSIIQSVQIQIGDAFLPILKDLLVQFSEIASSQGPKLVAFFGNIAESIKAFIARIQGLITTFQAGGLFGSRSGSFGSEGLLAALGIPPEYVSIIENVFNTINEVIAGFQEGGVGGAFGALFSSESATNAIQGVVDIIAAFIAEKWPIIQDQLLIWRDNFFSWVAELYPQIPTFLTGIVQGIADWLGENWPTISDKLTEWATMFWDWAKEAAAGAAAALAGIGVALIAWASSSDAQTATMELGQQIGQMIYDALGLSAENQEGATSVLTTIGAGLLTAAGAIAGTLIVIGGQLVAGIVSGILEELGVNLEPTTFSELSNILSGIGENIITIATVIGENIITGIADGIASFQQSLEGKLIEVITGGINAVKSFLGIASPSTVFFQFGVDIIQGLIDGIGSLLGGLTEIGGQILGSLFGGGEGEVATPTMPEFDTAAMQEGLSAVNTLINQINTGLTNIATVTLLLLTEATILFVSTVTPLWQQVIMLVTTIDTILTTIATVTLPAVATATQTTTSIMISGFTAVNAILTVTIGLIDEIVKGMNEIASAAEDVVKAFEDLGDKGEDALSDVVSWLDKATKAADKLADALSDAISAMGGLGGAITGLGFGTGTGFRRGVGFRTGSEPLGFLVPPGFPNDTFPINVTSGERVVVSPPGRSIEEVVAPRMMQMLAGSLGARQITVQIGPNNISSPMDLAMVEAAAERVVQRL